MGTSTVLKNIPQDQLNKLNELLLARPKGLESVKKIHAHLRIRQRYGITSNALQRYANRLMDEKVQLEAELQDKVEQVQYYQIRLPSDVHQQVDRAIVSRPAGLESIEKIYAHYKLKIHGVALQRFARYCRFTKWKNRLSAAGQLVGALFCGQEDKAAEVCSSTYLRLVATVLNALEENPNKISTAELQKLSKILAEQRGAAAKEKDLELKERKLSQQPEKQEPTHPLSDELPENFDEVVKQIYGIELATPQNDQ